MNDKKRKQLGAQIAFWGSNWMETVGMGAGMGLVMYLFMCFGSSASYGGGSVREMIAILPYYILLAGVFSIFLVGVAYFQTYFSVLVSMNATRRAAVISILINIVTMLLGVMAVAVLIWKLVPNEISEAGLDLMPLFTGILLITAALCVLLGSIITRWGKVGMIVFAILCMVIGGCVGASFAIVDSAIIEKMIGMLMELKGSDFWFVAAAGAAVYLLSGIFAAAVTRKMEVRV